MPKAKVVNGRAEAVATADDDLDGERPVQVPLDRPRRGRCAGQEEQATDADLDLPAAPDGHGVGPEEHDDTKGEKGQVDADGDVTDRTEDDGGDEGRDDEGPSTDP